METYSIKLYKKNFPKLYTVHSLILAVYMIGEYFP